MVALVTAAGSGTRVGGNCKKQFLSLGGVSILRRSLTPFDHHPDIHQIIVTLPASECTHWQGILSKDHTLTTPVLCIPGGTTRQDSVRLGLEAAVSFTPEIVLIHDAARPLLSDKLLREIIISADINGAALPVLPVKDTIKIIRDGMLVSTLDRSTLGAAQTPQAFRFPLILELHRQALSDGIEVTDDASIFEHYGHPVAALPGEETNFKVTTPEDLERARAILQENP